MEQPAIAFQAGSNGWFELPAMQVMSQCFTEDPIPPPERIQLLRTLPQSGHEAGDTQISPPDDDIGRLVPLGTRRMSPPTTFALTDRNGIRRYCIAEAIKTTWHVMVLILVTAPLTRRHIIFPAGF